jgi:hypothetical protein
MIVFDLACGDGHRFEAWFRSGAAFDEQQEAGVLACPVCRDTRIIKAPMAPRLALAAVETPPRVAEKSATGKEEVARALAGLRSLIEANCEDVGGRFAEEARRIHFGESTARGIYGEASREEAAALREDGIDYQVLPWWQRRNG